MSKIKRYLRHENNLCYVYYDAVISGNYRRNVLNDACACKGTDFVFLTVLSSSLESFIEAQSCG